MDSGFRLLMGLFLIMIVTIALMLSILGISGLAWCIVQLWRIILGF